MIHLKEIKEFLPNSTNCRISLKPNASVIYLGKPFSDVKSSLFYCDLPVSTYKLWLKQEMESKSNVYEALTELTSLLISSPKVLITCICDCEEEENRCRAIILRKTIIYLMVKTLSNDWSFT
jgi:hypothetical protein